MPLQIALDSIRADLTGRVVSDDELDSLRNIVAADLIPSWFTTILKTYPIVGSTFSLPDTQDESQIGVEMRWLTPAQIADEASEAYPGIAAIKLGYLPVGSCLEGSGDPYFLQLFAAEDPPLVRIPHNSLNSHGELDESKIEVVSRTLSGFFREAELA